MLYLASRSPRRMELLGRLGVPFRALELDVPEIRSDGETPLAYVRRVALEKAVEGLRQASVADGGAWVLGSDTEVVLGDRVYGKPHDDDDARGMLATLSGRTHQVITAVALVGPHGVTDVIEVISEVSFAAMSSTDIAAYVATGEPMGKAGGYAIQGGAERHVHRLCGSYSGVMGLPLQQTADLLARHDLLMDVVQPQGN